MDSAVAPAERSGALAVQAPPRTFEQYIAEGVEHATQAAFNPRGDDMLSRHQTIATCAGLVAFLRFVEDDGRSIQEHREAIENLRISLRD